MSSKAIVKTEGKALVQVGVLELEQFPVAEAAKPRFARAFGPNHQGTDIFAPLGSVVLAVRDGRARNMEEPKGGRVVYLTADDGSRYYYAHLQDWKHGAELGQDYPVRAGDELGHVGTTGNAAGTEPHLHFQMQPAQGQPWVDPFPYLENTAPKGAAVKPKGNGNGWGMLVVLYLLAKRGGRGRR